MLALLKLRSELVLKLKTNLVIQTQSFRIETNGKSNHNNSSSFLLLRTYNVLRVFSQALFTMIIRANISDHVPGPLWCLTYINI